MTYWAFSRCWPKMRGSFQPREKAKERTKMKSSNFQMNQVAITDTKIVQHQVASTKVASSFQDATIEGHRGVVVISNRGEDAAQPRSVVAARGIVYGNKRKLIKERVLQHVKKKDNNRRRQYGIADSSALGQGDDRNRTSTPTDGERVTYSTT